MTMTFRQMSSLLGIEIDGLPLPADVESLLVRSTVSDHITQPDSFVLEFRDPSHDVLGRIGATVGKPVKLTCITGDDAGGAQLMVGEITAVETEFDATGSRTFVRGYDKSHRLMRGRGTEAWTNLTTSDAVNKIAGDAGIGTTAVEGTDIVYEQLAKPNVSDWEELTALARESGNLVAVRDGSLRFGPPTEADTGPDVGDATSQDPLQLTPATNLLRFRAVVSSAEQVSEARVRSWDYRNKQSVEGTAPATASLARIGSDPVTLAGSFGSPTITAVTVPYGSQAEVDSAAKALAERVGSRFVTLDGTAVGSHKLRAGTAVSLGLAGSPFEGKYVLTTTCHRFDSDEGYTTSFTVGSGSEDSLVGLTGGGGRGGGPDTGRFDGVVPAIVTDVRDPDDIGRVKVKFPWLADQYESDWARMTQPGAGPNRGMVFLPEVNDEVLVAFEHGDFRRPYVVGALYNGQDKPNLGDDLVDGSSGAVKRRGYISPKGSALVFLDEDTKEGIALLASDGSVRISLSTTDTTIKITSTGEIQIKGDGDVTVKAGGSLSLAAQTSVSIEAGTSLELKGATVKIHSDGPLTAEGTPIQLN